MKLFIAEKPSMGRSIAKNLPGPHVTKDGYVETSGGIVTWCIGHLLETCPPNDYDKKFEAFPGKFEFLPIVPEQWKLKISGDKAKQVNTIKGLLKKCTEVVNAGDPGREGQLIIDELLDFLQNTKPVKRILLNALDDISVKRELNNLHDNKKFFSMYQAGLGRQRADWIIGMNLSRAYSILGSQAGFRGVLSVGRVQSPTLAIVVKRDREIENFIPKDYWNINGLFETVDKKTFSANWVPKTTKLKPINENDDDEEDDEANHDENIQNNKPIWLDEHNRIIDKTIAQSIVDKVKGKKGIILEAINKSVKEPPPLPFDLSAIQILANSKWAAAVQDTLQACQSLYEKGYTTYPRTDCVYLPESQYDDASQIIKSISQSVSGLTALCSNADVTLKSRAWNDKKLGEHHAIIPTRQSADFSKLTPLEKNIYEAIAKRFLVQFYPAADVDKTRIMLEVEQEKFSVSGRIIVNPGWKIVYNDNPENEKEGDDSILPAVKNKDTILAKEIKLIDKKTQPPSRYTEGTLLDAMKKVHLLVDDPVVKKKLKDLEGIGRSATRAAIIETLNKRGFLEKKSKQIISTQTGRALVDALPLKLIDPALTAMWEQILDNISAGKASLDAFTEKQKDFIGKLVETAKTQTISGLPENNFKNNNKSNNANSNKSKPKGKKCPKCNDGTLIKRTIKNGDKAGNSFFGCSNYPNCKYVENDNKPKK